MTHDHTASAEDSSAHHWDRTHAVPETGGYILASNLEAALSEAIKVCERYDSARAFIAGGKSAFRAGLEANLAYLRAHGTLEVR